jgi:FkbM family methyltransferase
MVFPNIRRLLKIGSPINSLKLILAAGTTTRPKYRNLFLGLLRPFVHQGEITVRYRCYEGYRQSTLRISDLGADFFSTLELGVMDIYRLDRGFRPDLVVDGGGNIGLFTLIAAGCYATANGSSPKFVICEPLPKNIDQIRKHLRMNAIDAEIMPYCIGGSRGSIPFYCRAANESSFNPQEEYDSVLQIPVVLITDTLNQPAERILIKLDIEGMEVEALSAFLPQERRAVYIVGELHDYPVNAPLMRHLFDEHGWTLELFDIDQQTSSFRACSPAAAPLLEWAAQIGAQDLAEDSVASK